MNVWYFPFWILVDRGVGQDPRALSVATAVDAIDVTRKRTANQAAAVAIINRTKAIRLDRRTEVALAKMSRLK